MRIVVNHSPKQANAIGRVFGRVENMLMPEVIKVVLPLRIGPGHKHEARLHLQQCKKTDVFRTGCLRPFQAPALLFYQSVAHRVEIEFLGDGAWLRGERSLDGTKDNPPNDK
jgi:hypothetical protein